MCGYSKPFPQEPCYHNTPHRLLLIAFGVAFWSLCLLVSPSAFAGYLDLTWTAPTQNEDASPLTDLGGYVVYYGTVPSAVIDPPCNTNPTAVTSSTATTFHLTGLTAGTPYYVTLTAVNTVGVESACSAEASAAANADPGTPSAPTSPSSPTLPSSGATPAAASDSGSAGPCFIATAAYGSPLAPQVQHLREFRDRYLMTNTLGRSFVAFYYRTSPPIASAIGTSEILRLLTQFFLLPILAFALVANFSLALALGLFFTILGACLLLLRLHLRGGPRRHGQVPDRMRISPV